MLSYHLKSQEIPVANIEERHQGQYWDSVTFLLEKLGNKLEPWRVIEASPDTLYEYNLQDIVETMHNLMYRGDACPGSADQFEEFHTPCLFLAKDGKPFVVASKIEKKAKVWSPRMKEAQYVDLHKIQGTFIRFRKIEENSGTLFDQQKEWFSKIISRFRNPLTFCISLSFVVNLFTVASPLIIMLLIGQVTTDSTVEQWVYLAIGASLYVLSLAGFQLLRTRLLSFLGARSGVLINNQVMRRLMHLPASYTEMASLNSQISRIKDFHSIPDLVSSNAFVSLLDAPFVIISILLLFYFGPKMALVSLGTLALFIIVGFFFSKIIKTQTASGANKNKEKADLMNEIIGMHSEIKSIGLTSHFYNEFCKISHQTSYQNLKSQNVYSLIGAFSSWLVMISGLMTMAFGIELVINGELSPPALMAAMLLTWRVLSPIRNGFIVATQASKTKVSIKQVDRLMNMTTEKNMITDSSSSPIIKGNIRFERVSLRYKKNAHPALLGVSFNIIQGETVVILGHGGAGKSTILKMLLGMYTPQTGRVIFDNINLSQFDSSSLRRQLAYMPERPTFFGNTIRESLFMVNPTAGEEELELALGETGLMADIEKLPHGLDTPIDQHNISQLSSSFLRRLSLGLMFLKNSKVWLLDNPGFGLEDMHERQFLATLEAAHGMATIIIATQNEEYLSFADKVILMYNGRIRFHGSVEEFKKGESLKAS